MLDRIALHASLFLCAKSIETNGPGCAVVIVVIEIVLVLVLVIVIVIVIVVVIIIIIIIVVVVVVVVVIVVVVVVIAMVMVVVVIVERGGTIVAFGPKRLKILLRGLCTRRNDMRRADVDDMQKTSNVSFDRIKFYAMPGPQEARQFTQCCGIIPCIIESEISNLQAGQYASGSRI